MVWTNNINSTPTNTPITSPVWLEANWFVNRLLLNKNHKQLQNLCPIFNGIYSCVLVLRKPDIVDEGWVMSTLKCKINVNRELTQWMKLDFIYTISCFSLGKSLVVCLKLVQSQHFCQLYCIYDWNVTFWYLVTKIKERAEFFVICLYNGSNKY